MSEIPERIEREMFEIRNRMGPDVTDLRDHINPKVVGNRVKNNLQLRVQGLKNRVTSDAKTRRQEFMTSLQRQIDLAKEAGEKRDPGPLTDAVKSDPLPMVALAVVLAVALVVVRRAGRG